MTVFDVFVNDRPVCRAGIGRVGVLSATVSWVRLTGEAQRTARRLKESSERRNWLSAASARASIGDGGAEC
jgi:hypothetical protein